MSNNTKDRIVQTCVMCDATFSSHKVTPVCSKDSCRRKYKALNMREKKRVRNERGITWLPDKPFDGARCPCYGRWIQSAEVMAKHLGVKEADNV